MIFPSRIDSSLKEALLRAKGRVLFDAPLGPLTWFGAGGSAQVFVRPYDLSDLMYIQRLSYDNGLPVTVLGVGSNVIVRDGGIPGVVIKLGRSSFSKIDLIDHQIKAGSGALDRTVAETARQHSLGGLEFLLTIPGSIGGNVVMNAGAYGQETKDIVVEVYGVTKCGECQVLQNSECGFAYRSSQLPEGFIVTHVLMEGSMEKQENITYKMQDLLKKREEAQPVRSRTCGSTFKNLSSELKAWQLIDAAGCRGLRVGAAQVSDMHCNFLLNLGGATATDLEDLGELVKLRVLEHCGIVLEWEIKRLGLKNASNE